MKKTLILILLAALSAIAEENPLTTAQKAYVAGNWKDAAAAYEKACPLQPKEKQAECMLWNVLALSQTGTAKAFKQAGKRLDSLIQQVSPQDSLYADLLMTSAQFRLYLGKYDLAAEDLIHAIETSKPKHNIVLQKVCQAVKAKVTSDALNERCELLKHPDSLAQASLAPTPVDTTKENTVAMTDTAKVDSANIDTIKTDSSKISVKVSDNADSINATETPKDTAKIDSLKEAPLKVDSTKKEPTPAAKADTIVKAIPQPKQAEAAPQPPQEEYWILQLGAYSVKAYADLMVSNLKKQKIACTIIEQPRGDKVLYLVQTGHFATKEAAIDFAADKLVKQKIEYQPLLKK